MECTKVLAHKSFVCHFIKSLILNYCYMQLYCPKNEFRKLNVILWMAKNFVDAYYWNSYFALGIRTAIGFEYQSCIWEFRKCSIIFSDNIIIQHRLKNTTYYHGGTYENQLYVPIFVQWNINIITTLINNANRGFYCLQEFAWAENLWLFLQFS